MSRLPSTALDQVSFDMLRKEALINEICAALSPAGAFGRWESKCEALALWLYGGTFEISGVPTKLYTPAGFNATLADAATNYVRLSEAGIIDVVTSIPAGWPAKSGIFYALWDITCAGGVQTAWNDWRKATAVGTLLGSISGLGAGVAAWLATPSSANLYAALTTKTGTGGNVVFATDPQFTPSASVTPASNGNLVIEATSNTRITLKLKGSDGTVRSFICDLDT